MLIYFVIDFWSILASILGPIFLPNRLKYDKVVRHHHVFFHLRFLSPLWGTPWLLNPPCTPLHHPPIWDNFQRLLLKIFCPCGVALGVVLLRFVPPRFWCAFLFPSFPLLSFASWQRPGRRLRCLCVRFSACLLVFFLC